MNPVYNAANKELLMFGIERTMLSASLLAAVLVFWLLGLMAAAVVFAGLFTAAKLLTRKDPKMAQILIASAKLGRLYDSAERE